MKIVEYGKAAADAEVLLLKKKSVRVGKCVFLCIVAAVFGVFSLITLHAVLAALCLWLFKTGFLGTSLIVLAFDILGVVLFLLLAFKGGITEAEMKARVIRDHNLKELRSSIALTTLIGMLTGPIGGYVRQYMWQFVKGKFGKKSH